MPWKNSQGITYEIQISPATTSLAELNFDYRLSMAEINSENTFSQFKGFARFLSVVKGEGITFNDELIKQYEIKSFSGDETVVSRPILENERIIDLGLIYNPKKIKAVMKFIKILDETFPRNEFDRCYLVDLSNLNTIILNQKTNSITNGAYILIGINTL